MIPLAWRFKARRLIVEADSIKARPGKQHQTNTHNAKSYKAAGKVDVVIDKQYLNRNDNPQRPPAGSKASGRSALISSRNVDYLGPADDAKRTKGIFRDNVIVDLDSSDSSDFKSNGSEKRSSKKKGGRRV